MKRLFQCFIITLLAVLAISYPIQVMAAEDLEIKEWVVDAQVQSNGDLRIVEDITFEFNDKFNGVFREIVTKGTSGVVDIKVEEITGDLATDYMLVNDADKGDSKVYLVKEEKKGILIQIFSPSKNEEKTFRISYMVKNVAVRYNDTGELYYKFLGNENETPIEMFRVNIKLPMADTKNHVKVFAHGPLNGKIKKVNDNFYSLSVKNVPRKTFVEGRILFPKEFISESSRVENIDNYNNILEEEAAFQEKLVRDRERNEAIRKVLKQLVFLTSVILLIICILFILRLKRPPFYLEDGYQSLPLDCTPAMASLITGRHLGSNVIFATILDLCRKDYVKISRKYDDLDYQSKGQDYVISQTRQSDNSLYTHERYLIQWLIHKVGDEKAVSMEGIERYSKKNNTEFMQSYRNWKEKIKEDTEARGYYDKSKTKEGGLIIVVSFFLFILSISVLIMEDLTGLLGLFVSMFAFIYGITLSNRLSDFGYQQYKKFIHFIKYMNKYPIDLTDDDLVDTLDTSLIYGMSLGVKNKMKDSYSSRAKQYETLYSNHSWLLWYFVFTDSSKQNTLNKRFSQSFVSIDSQSSGGGFSAGGGGGAGGGGAGGF